MTCDLKERSLVSRLFYCNQKVSGQEEDYSSGIDCSNEWVGEEALPGCWTTELHPELLPPLLLSFVPGITPVMLAKMTFEETPTGTLIVRGKKAPTASLESPLTLQ